MLSYSGISSIQLCGYKYWLGKTWDIREKPEERVSMDIGGALHCFAKWMRYNSRPDLLPEGENLLNPYSAIRSYLLEAKQDELNIRKAEALAVVYENVDVVVHPDELFFPEDLVAIEPHLFGKIVSIPVHGFVDAVIKGKDGFHIVETKTSGQLGKNTSRNFQESWWRQYPNSQLAIYLLLARQRWENVSNIIVMDVIVKPMLRQAKSDEDIHGNFSIDKFIGRYRRELESNIPAYFVRHRVEVTSELLTATAGMVNSVSDRISAGLVVEKNLTSCYNWLSRTLCPLFNHCCHGKPIEQMGYSKKERKEVDFVPFAGISEDPQ